MARTQEKDKDKIEISQFILQKVPREAEVTRIEYGKKTYACSLHKKT